MPGVKFVLPDNSAITLMYNGIAILRMKERGADRRIIAEDTENGEKALFEVASALAEGGELYNRYMSAEHKDIPDAEVFSKLNNVQKALLKIAVLRSIIEDSGDDGAETDEEEDVGLSELAEQNKKNNSVIMSELLSVGMLAGLNSKETLLLPIGTLNRLADQNAKMRGVSKWRTM